MEIAEKTNVERLAERFKRVPRIEETGPKHGFNGEAMARLALRSRLIYVAMCVVGMIPLALKLLGNDVSPQLVAMGFGCLVPGGGFMACGGAATMPLGIFVMMYLWKKKGMWWQDIYGTFLGIAGFWLLGILGGLLAHPALSFWYVVTADVTPYWGYILAVAAAFYLWGGYEMRVRKTYKRIAENRRIRIASFDQAINELDAAMNKYDASNDTECELDEDQLGLARYLLNATVREIGDFTGMDNFPRPILTDNRYQFPSVGYALLVMQCKYTPNFHGYVAKAQRFIIDAITDPRTCGYWYKSAKIGYWEDNPDPIAHANIMLSGWMMPVVTGYGAQTGDRRFEEDGALKFRPFKDDLSRSYDYSVKGAVEVVYKQYHSKMYPYMLIPCEPHVAFPICNSYALLGLLIYDRDHGTHYCEDFFDDLYKYLTDNFVEAEGSFALRRQYTYGLRFIPESQIMYDPMADVQNYLMYAPVFPGLAKRNYAMVRKHSLEIIDGVTYIKGRKWEEIFDISTMKRNPSLIMSNLEMLAAEYGDTEILDGLHKAESIFLERSKDPKYFKFKDVPVVVMANFAVGRFLRKGFWSDVILRGPDKTAFTGPVLTDCVFPEVLVAKAMSHGDDLDLVLYNGEEPGAHDITVERLKPGARYKVESTGSEFGADNDGKATISVNLDGRTPVHIVPCA